MGVKSSSNGQGAAKPHVLRIQVQPQKPLNAMKTFESLWLKNIQKAEKTARKNGVIQNWSRADAEEFLTHPTNIGCAIIRPPSHDRGDFPYAENSKFSPADAPGMLMLSYSYIPEGRTTPIIEHRYLLPMPLVPNSHLNKADTKMPRNPQFTPNFVHQNRDAFAVYSLPPTYPNARPLGMMGKQIW